MNVCIHTYYIHIHGRFLGIFDFQKVEGKFISVMITGRNEKKETYRGIVIDCEGDFLVLKFRDPSSYYSDLKHPIDEVVIRKTAIESIWIYRESDE